MFVYRSYYFGENPHDVPNNGGERELLNSSFEGATPHKGEVVRIKVPFQEPQEGSQETGGKAYARFNSRDIDSAKFYSRWGGRNTHNISM